MSSIEFLQQAAVAILKQLIALPSLSRLEQETADFLENTLSLKGFQPLRIGNNIICKTNNFKAGKPVLLLNSHHDTVKPNSAYTFNPFEAVELDGKLYGLGSNDAGASLVSLLTAFLFFAEKDALHYNLVFIASAEEEVSGADGISSLFNNSQFLEYVGEHSETNWSNWAGIVGEPTEMKMAEAERGLMVIDAYAKGMAGHAARGEGKNAILVAMEDIALLQSSNLPKVSSFLGAVNTTVTVIETENKQHNVIPTSCHYVIDVRLNECYTTEEILDWLQKHLRSQVKARSTRLKSTTIDLNHPIVKAGLALGKEIYGSPTMSDKALIPFPCLKMGPGNSARSHTADEFIFIDEIKQGLLDYINLLEKLNT